MALVPTQMVGAIQTIFRVDRVLASEQARIQELDALIIPQKRGLTGERLREAFGLHFRAPGSLQPEEESDACATTATQAPPIASKDLLRGFGNRAWAEVIAAIMRMGPDRTLVVCDDLLLQLMAHEASYREHHKATVLEKAPGPCEGYEIIIEGDSVVEINHLD